jgi:hypothetical protein
LYPFVVLRFAQHHAENPHGWAAGMPPGYQLWCCALRNTMPKIRMDADFRQRKR